MELLLFILLITFLGPLIGSLIGVLKKPSKGFMYVMLSFAAGVMMAVSFLELIPESIALSSVWIAIAGVLIGSLAMFSMDRLIPHIHPELCSQEQGKRLKRTAFYLLVGIFLHNFPEGMAIAIGAVSEIKLSLVVALAIAIHDIPEGICTSAPYYYVTKKRLKSFLISSSTVIPTMAGFLIAYYLYNMIPLSLVGLLIGATAGLMIYISGDELIPESCGKCSGHMTIFSFMAGIIFVMLLGLI